MTIQNKAVSLAYKNIVKNGGIVVNWHFLSTYSVYFCAVLLIFTPNVNSIEILLASDGHKSAYTQVYEQARQGDVEAQHQFAIMCRNGQDTAKDPIEAVKWFRLAAEQGKTESQEQLALALLSGTGVGQDNIEAAKWLSLAAKQNSPSALYMLANMHLKGEGVVKNSVKAYELFTQSAELGFTKSMLKQADMLIFGQGVQKNTYEGILLYSKAALAGDHLAQSKITELEEKKLCLFSAKTQLFGRYLKCVSGKELQRLLIEKGAVLTSKDDQFKKTYNSLSVLKGTRSLELMLTSNDRVARLQYVFDRHKEKNQQINKATKSMPQILKLRKMLERKYGSYDKKDGVLGAGSVKYEWLMKDKVSIVLSQETPWAEVHLEYVFFDRVDEYYAERKAEKQRFMNKSFVFDHDAY